jgi:hypothetical protein
LSCHSHACWAEGPTLLVLLKFFYRLPHVHFLCEVAACKQAHPISVRPLFAPLMLEAGAPPPPHANRGRGERAPFLCTHSRVITDPQLKYESSIYQTLAGGVSVPFVRWFGTECDFNSLVINLPGPSLKDLFNFCNCKFSLKTLLLLCRSTSDGEDGKDKRHHDG